MLDTFAFRCFVVKILSREFWVLKKKRPWNSKIILFCLSEDFFWSWKLPKTLLRPQPTARPHLMLYAKFKRPLTPSSKKPWDTLVTFDEWKFLWTSFFVWSVWSCVFWDPFAPQQQNPFGFGAPQQNPFGPAQPNPFGAPQQNPFGMQPQQPQPWGAPPVQQQPQPWGANAFQQPAQQQQQNPFGKLRNFYATDCWFLLLWDKIGG